MRKLWVKLSIIGAALFWLSVGFAQPKTVINLGIYAPFSNEQSIIGRTLLVTLEVLREQINAEGIQYNYYTLDQLPATAQSVRTVEKFVAAHKIKVLLTEGTGNGRFMAPIAKTNNLIHLNIGGDPKLADGVNTFATLSPEFAKDMQQLLDLKLKMSEHLDLDTLVAVQKLIKKLQANPQILELFQQLTQSVVQAAQKDNHCTSQQISTQLQSLSKKDKQVA